MLKKEWKRIRMSSGSLRVAHCEWCAAAMKLKPLCLPRTRASYKVFAWLFGVFYLISDPQKRGVYVTFNWWLIYLRPCDSVCFWINIHFSNTKRNIVCIQTTRRDRRVPLYRCCYTLARGRRAYAECCTGSLFLGVASPQSRVRGGCCGQTDCRACIVLLLSEPVAIQIHPLCHELCVTIFFFFLVFETTQLACQLHQECTQMGVQ